MAAIAYGNDSYLGGEKGPCSYSGITPLIHEEDIMAWKTPKIAEVSVGMEINLYVCADL